ncbi:circadian clock-controlled protein daywake-like [Spodoptera frugiperda]|uniref:Circadian clock-controlled protein daywake-like n=1 Tax=Spodoptera frugiperda TaxID=7108 RepID=A0A9R0DEX3_SPOFR|nr:circadian clock-controlled protein daywake-like [Spodoptera frugiperda]
MAKLVLLAAVGLFCLNGVIGPRVQCDFSDADCITRTSQAGYSDFVNGIPGVAPSDPLRQDFIVGNLPTIKYTIKDGVLSGFKKCFIELKRFMKDKTFDYQLRCPQLTLVGEYDLKGDLLNSYIEGKGPFKVELYDYRFLLHGNYETEKRDGKSYLQFGTYTVNLDAQGKVVYDLKNLFNGDKQKSDAALKMMNDNWKATDEAMCQPAMEAFMKVFVKNMNDYGDKVPVTDIFSYEQ